MKIRAKTLISKRIAPLLIAFALMFGFIGMFPQISVSAESVTPGIITTVAGTGISGNSGDGNLATLAKISFPDNIAVDAGGNLYFADAMGGTIRKVDGNTGIISTIAGTGGMGYSGDGGLAANAKLFVPIGIAFDAKGDLYFADSGNQRIRKIEMKTGIISTVVGTGSSNYSGDGGLAKNAALLYPMGVAFDAWDNLYIADTNNKCIRRVDAATGIITTVAGTNVLGYSGDGGLATAAKLNNPKNIALDMQGNLYIADCNNHCIRKVDAKTGIISTVAGMGTSGFTGDNGLAVNARLNSPDSIACDIKGNIYISDSGNNRIRRVSITTGIITTVVGGGMFGSFGDNGPAVNALLLAPRGISFDLQGNLLIADRSNNRIRSVANINSCKVDFNANGGTNVNSILTDNGNFITTPTMPTKAGYILTGWYKDAALTIPWNFATDIVTINTTLYAGWTPGYTATFNSNGGSAVASVGVKISSTLTEPTAPTMIGYTFVGWYTSSTSLMRVAFPYTPKGDVTFYARWIANSYTVTFNANGGTSIATPKTAKYNTAITAPPEPTNAGYTFNGWYTAATGGTKIIFPYTVTENVTLYAQWTKNRFTVTFNNDGIVVNSVTSDYNTVISAPPAPTKVGYTFSGWYTSAGLKVAFPFVVNNNMILYAKWTVNSYKVTFNSNGGTAVAQKIVNYNTTITAPTAPTKAGYSFAGWFTAPIGGTKIVFPLTVTTNITVYAQWVK